MRHIANHIKSKILYDLYKIKNIFNIFNFAINEFRTSKLCNCCHNELEKFMERPSKKPKTEGKVYFCHGLLRHKSVKPQCEVIHNRDKNAVQNMLNIVESIFNTGHRPTIFCREKDKISFPLHDGI